MSGVFSSLFSPVVDPPTGDVRYLYQDTPIPLSGIPSSAVAAGVRRNNLYRQTAFATEIGGTVVAGADTKNAGTYACTATSTSVRALTEIVALEMSTEKYYVFRAKISAVTLGAPISMSKVWFNNHIGSSPYTVAEGVTSLAFPASIPVAGSVVSITFKPRFAGTNTLRLGIGVNGSETCVIGDSITFTDIGVYEVPSLSSPVPDIAISPTFPNSPVVESVKLPGDCVLCVGDSWANGDTDFPGVLGTTYNREIVRTATGGHTLNQIRAAMTTLLSSDSNLSYPNKNIPGIAIIEGGINSLTGGATAESMITDITAMLLMCRIRGIVPIVIIPFLSSDSTNYTNARWNVLNTYKEFVKNEGCFWIDCGYFLTMPTGAANQSLMTSEGGLWVHPSQDGYNYIAYLCDLMCRRIDAAFWRGVMQRRWVIA